MESPDLVSLLSRVERKHRRHVLDRLESVLWLRSDPLRRGVGRDQLRVLGLEVLESTEELVELGVRDLGTSLDVVQVRVPIQLAA